MSGNLAVKPQKFSSTHVVDVGRHVGILRWKKRRQSVHVSYGLGLHSINRLIIGDFDPFDGW